MGLLNVLTAGPLKTRVLPPSAPSDIKIFSYHHSGIADLPPYGNSHYWMHELDGTYEFGGWDQYGTANARTQPPLNQENTLSGTLGTMSAWNAITDSITDVFIIHDNFAFPGNPPELINQLGDISYNDNHDAIIQLWRDNTTPTNGRRYWLYTYPVEPDGVTGWNGDDTVPDVDASSAAVANWITYGEGQYLTHAQELVAHMQSQHPGLDVRHMDIQAVFFDLLQNGPAAVRAMSMQEWFRDAAPHGLGEFHIIAAMAWYIQIYGQEPAQITPAAGANINAAITSNWSAITSHINSFLSGP